MSGVILSSPTGDKSYSRFDFDSSQIGARAILNPEICSKLFGGLDKWSTENRSLLRRYSGEEVEIVELIGSPGFWGTAKVRTNDGAEIYVRRIHLIRANGKNGKKTGGRQERFGSYVDGNV